MRAAAFSDEDRDRWLLIAGIRDGMKAQMKILQAQHERMVDIRKNEMKNYMELAVIGNVKSPQYDKLKGMYNHVETQLMSDSQSYNSKMNALVKSLDDYSTEGWTINAKYDQEHDNHIENKAKQIINGIRSGSPEEKDRFRSAGVPAQKLWTDQRRAKILGRPEA